MIVDLFVPLGVFFMLTVSVALLTRLVATALLNRTIREAIRSDPGSVPLLVGTLEARQPWAGALLGWIFLASAAGLILLALFEEPVDRREVLRAAVVPVVIGLTVLLDVRLARPKSA